MSDSNEIIPVGKPQVDVEFIAHLTLGDKKPGTVRSYRLAYSDFHAYAARLGGFGKPERSESEWLPTMASLLATDNGAANAIVTAYRVDMVARGLSPATVNNYLAAIRTFVGEAKRCGLTTWRLDVKNIPSKSYRDTAGPGHDGFKSMLSLSETRNDGKGRRDTAIMKLLYMVGLRRFEVAALDLAHFDPAREWGDGQRGGVSIIQKRDRERTWVGLPAPVRQAIESWIELRGSEPGPLFQNLDKLAQNTADGRRLSKGAIWKIVKSYGAKAGLAKAVSPHRLRHGGATRAAKLTNGNAVAVQAWGRWASLSTAAIYVDRQKDLQAQIATVVSAED